LSEALALIEPMNLVASNTSNDDVSRDDKLEARRVEMKKLPYFQAFEWVTEEEAERRGLRFIKSRWGDRCDARKAAVRSRWVLPDFSCDKAATPDLYAPTLLSDWSRL
jgi:hypothetical protein